VLGKEMLPEQILAGVISVRRAHDGVDVIPRGPVGGMECCRPHRSLVMSNIFNPKAMVASRLLGVTRHTDVRVSLTDERG